MEQMPQRFFSALALTLLVPGAAVDGHHAIVDASQPTTLTDAVMPHPTVAAYGSLPIRFEPNVGQTSPRAEYSARGNGYFVAMAKATLTSSAARARWISRRNSRFRAAIRSTIL